MKSVTIGPEWQELCRILNISEDTVAPGQMLLGRVARMTVENSVAKDQFVAEERQAWDRYAAAIFPSPGVGDVSTAADLADRLLTQRRKRFHPPGEFGGGSSV